MLHKGNRLSYLQILLLIRCLRAPTTPAVNDSLQTTGLWSIQPRHLWLTVRGKWWRRSHGGIRDGLALYTKCFSTALKINSHCQFRTVLMILLRKSRTIIVPKRLDEIEMYPLQVISDLWLQPLLIRSRYYVRAIRGEKFHNDDVIFPA